MEILDPFEQALSAVSIIRGSIMNANWDERPEQFHIALDRLRALEEFLIGWRALNKLGG